MTITDDTAGREILEVERLIPASHERIACLALREQHRQGWIGCIDGLIDYLGEK